MAFTVLPFNTLAATKTDETSSLQEMAFENLHILDKYLFKNDEGYLEIDVAIKEEIGEEIYEFYLNGIDVLNLTVEEGLISLGDNGDIVIENVEILNTVVDNDDIFIENMAQSDPYADALALGWTGYTFTFNNREARELQYQLEDNASAWGIATALLGGIASSVPNPGTIAAAAAAIMAVGNGWVANRIDRNITSSGVTIKIQWLPYPGVIVNGR
ncbi:hypothetical protein AWH56_009165 [Anaerobacillus isosaccharinicus]|uniref:Uncharacterized protein n=1 Tax=Anaerobacillus isosaccharinicus TaxID=1532552 RepID=A0A7S7RD82_9BACI|nr:hypothetical protein [Anaerobacillus isosaccharinicus]MBA5588882.1 hypothetical protein [Anaerobacillus isosaccharinicus]QOY37731.1 hypothetical protein AWH56_009165 [Anaerobacillus isosaccharinicus]